MINYALTLLLLAPRARPARGLAGSAVAADRAALLAGFARRVAECNDLSAAGEFVPLVVGGERVGAVQPEHAALLVEVAPETFALDEGDARCLQLAPSLASPAARTAAVAVAACLLYTSPSPRDGLLSRMPSSA